MTSPVLTLPEAREQVRELATLFHAPAQQVRSVQPKLPGQEEDLIAIAAQVIRKADDLLANLAPLPHPPLEPPNDELATLHTLTLGLRDAAFVLMQEVNPDQAWFWTRSWQSGEREADADYTSGRFHSYDSTDDFLAPLKRVGSNPHPR